LQLGEVGAIDHGSETREITEHDSRTYSHGFKRASCLGKNNVVDGQSFFRFGSGSLKSFADDIECDARTLASLAYRRGVCRLSGVVTENGSARGLAGQRWTRSEPGKVYGIKQHPDIFAGKAGDLFEPLLTPVVHGYVAKYAGEDQEIVVPGRGVVADKER
jgi:hypothetical protein